MKGMSFALLLVVTAIVIIVVALVVITIFTGGLGSVGSITEMKNQCRMSAQTTCAATGQLPADWKVRNKQVEYGSGVETTSCEMELSGCDCVNKELTQPCYVN